jgi:hypothetical protein
MAESIQSETANNMSRKYAYGIECWCCKQQILVGFAWLKNDAQIEDLRANIEARGGILGSLVCNRLADGRVCGAGNCLTLVDLVFVDDFLWALDKLADSLSQE